MYLVHKWVLVSLSLSLFVQPFWGLPEDPSEQGTLLGLKLPKEPVNIPHEMFFWPNEEEFLRRAARAFENTSKALFAPSSELRAVTMSSEMENKMTEPTDVLEDILHCKENKRFLNSSCFYNRCLITFDGFLM